MTPMPYRPRAERDRQRMRAAVARQAAIGSAMDAALAQIDAAFDEAAAVNDFKLRIERFIRLGPQSAVVSVRFGGRAELLSGRSLDAALAVVERWWRDQRKAFQIASALGFGNRLSLEVLRELRLVLRLMRYKKIEAEFDAIVTALCGDTLPLAAE
jgi:hypothetical protein